MEKKKYILGSIAIILALSFVIISMPGIGVKMRVDEDKTTFYVKLLDDAGIPYGRYLVSGREYNRLFSGNTLQYRDKSTININTTIDNATNSTTIIRSTGYQNGAIIKDTYEFDGGTTDVELFPVSHKVEVINGSGLFYRYTVDELKDTGEKRKLIDEYEISFGMRMKVELDEGYNWAWIGWPYGSDSLSAQYKIETDYEVFNVRLSDPLISSNLLYDDFNDDSYNTTLWETLQIGSGGGGAVTEAGSEYLYLKGGSDNNVNGETVIGSKNNVTSNDNFIITTALKTDSTQTNYNQQRICFYVDYMETVQKPYNGVCVYTFPGGSFPNDIYVDSYENGVNIFNPASEVTDTVPQASYLNRTIRVSKIGSNTTLNITNGVTNHYYVLPGDYSGAGEKIIFSTGPISHGVYWDYFNISGPSEVNNTPVFDQDLVDKSVSYNANLSYDINCSGSGTIMYYDNSSLFNINSSTGVIFDNPSLGEVDNYKIMITCGNESYNTSQTFNYTITNGYPYYSLNNPVNGATGESTSTTLNITITDPDSDNMNITFYNTTNNIAICTNTSISSGSNVLCTWNTTSYNTMYNWSINVTDGVNTNSSPTWNFTTSELETQIVLNSPDDQTVTSDNTPDFNFTIFGNESYNAELFLNDTKLCYELNEGNSDDLILAKTDSHYILPRLFYLNYHKTSRQLLKNQ